MNFLIAGLGANITIGLISAITATTNGVYTLCGNIAHSTATGAGEVKHIIQETDLEMKIKMMQFLLCELHLDENTSHTLHFCIKSIKDAIEEISNELEKIHYRMQYNDSLWIGSSVRSYGFQNSKLRLSAKVKTLESRYKTLMDIMSIQNKMYKNSELEETLSKSVLFVDNVDPKSAALVRADLRKKLEFMTQH